MSGRKRPNGAAPLPSPASSGSARSGSVLRVAMPVLGDDHAIDRVLRAFWVHSSRVLLASDRPPAEVRDLSFERARQRASKG